MNQLVDKYHKLCLNERRVISAQDLNTYFSPMELSVVYEHYYNVETFVDKSLQEDNFYKNNEAMFSLCFGCPFLQECRGNPRAKCVNNEPMQIDNVEFIGDEKLLKWFYINTLLYLHEHSASSKILGGFFDIFKNVTKIKLKKRYIIMYSDNFHHYERVKNAQFLSYQGSTVEKILSQITELVSGKEYEFYFDNPINETEIKSPIEEKMFNALNNHPTLRRKYKFNLDQQHIISDAFGNVMFTLDMLLNVEGKFKLCIECDGYNYHSDPERFERDRLRDRTLLKQGIYTARFSSYDINYRLDDSITDIIEIIDFHMHKTIF